MGDAVCAALASALLFSAKNTKKSLDLRDNNLTGPTETSPEALARLRPAGLDQTKFFLPQETAPLSMSFAATPQVRHRCIIDV
eukprot:COSAG05_NODE_825_length_7106_cov_74.690881_15_plen_83_part_00